MAENSNGNGLDRSASETIDGKTGKPIATPRTINLSNLRDVRLEMAYVYRQVDCGNLKAQEGTRRVYILRQIGDILTVAELETRLVELEERYTKERSLQRQGRLATIHG